MGKSQASIEQMQAYIKKVNPQGVRFGHKDDLSVHHRRINRGRAWRHCICSELPGDRQLYVFRISSNLDQNNFCGLGVKHHGKERL